MANRPDSFLPLFVADYLADTSHLTRDQHGAYLLLLMAYWRRGGPLPADDTRLANIAKATAAEWRKLKPVMLEFFAESAGLWTSKRSDEEIAKATARSEAKAEAGRRGAASRWQTDGSAIVSPLANTMTKNGSSPLPKQPTSKEDVGKKEARGARASQPKPAKGLRWPADAVVPDDWIIEAEAYRQTAKQLPVIDLRAEALKFANYWAAKAGGGSTKIDWKRTWLNWVLSAKTAGGSNGKSGQHGQTSSHPLGWFAEFADEAARAGRGEPDA